MLIKYFGYSSEFKQLILDSYQFYNHELVLPGSHGQFFYDFQSLYIPEDIETANRRRMQSSSGVYTMTTGYDSISTGLYSKVTDTDLTNPAQIFFDQKVIGINKNDDKYDVITESNSYTADQGMYIIVHVRGKMHFIVVITTTLKQQLL